jgi:hypothetical protein
MNYDSVNGVSRLDGNSGKQRMMMGGQAPPALATRFEPIKGPFLRKLGEWARHIQRYWG